MPASLPPTRARTAGAILVQEADKLVGPFEMPLLYYQRTRTPPPSATTLSAYRLRLCGIAAMMNAVAEVSEWIVDAHGVLAVLSKKNLKSEEGYLTAIIALIVGVDAQGAIHDPRLSDALTVYRGRARMVSDAIAAARRAQYQTAHAAIAAEVAAAAAVAAEDAAGAAAAAAAAAAGPPPAGPPADELDWKDFHDDYTDSHPDSIKAAAAALTAMAPPQAPQAPAAAVAPPRRGTKRARSPPRGGRVTRARARAQYWLNRKGGKGGK